MRYIYLGDRLTRADLKNMPCDPVRRTDGRAVVSRRRASALVVDSSGVPHVVARRRLRLVEKLQKQK